MAEFEDQKEVNEFLDELQEWLEEQYPLQGRRHPIFHNTQIRLSTQAENMVRGMGKKHHELGKDLSKISKDLTDHEATLSHYFAPQSEVMRFRQAYMAAIEANIAKPSSLSSFRGGRQWWARMVAERCASHFHFWTGRKLTFGIDPSSCGSQPSTDFGRLVRDAFEKFNVKADWRNPSREVWKRFDYQAMRVVDWG